LSKTTYSKKELIIFFLRFSLVILLELQLH
jgi:hypothetical protein